MSSLRHFYNKIDSKVKVKGQGQMSKVKYLSSISFKASRSVFFANFLIKCWKKCQNLDTKVKVKYMFFQQKWLSRSRPKGQGQISRSKVKGQGHSKQVKVSYLRFFMKTLKKMPKICFQGHSQGQGHISIFPAILPIFSQNLRNQPIFHWFWSKISKTQFARTGQTPPNQGP